MGRDSPTTSRLTGPLPLLGLCTFVGFIVLAIPGVEPWYLGPASALETLLSAAPFALAYLLAAMGWGTRLDALWRSAREAGAWAIQLSVGLAVMLLLSHLMGVAGLLRTGVSGLALAWLPIVLGILMFVVNILREGRRDSAASASREKDSYLLLAAAPTLAALFLAACVPPGMLWTSEARGFDVLSYHLQLPREWLAAGQIAPLEHNAYSWLPSYMEAAYMHLGAMTSFIAPDPFTQGDGVATFASQLLHALIAVAAAACVGALVSTILKKQGEQTDRRRFASSLGAILFLTTPWVVVTGSLAYNEMPVCLFLAAAMLVCETGSLTTLRRGALVGLLVGAACCAKPTALFMVGVPVGVLMLIRTARGEWVRAFSIAAVVGLLMLAPWLARNAIASGNPVFPYLTSNFGDGHWSAIEVARWSLGHHESAGFGERLRILLSSKRGVTHEHFMPVTPVALILVVTLCLYRPVRTTVMPCVIMLTIQIAIWLSMGHLQSRFLLPLLAPLVVSFSALARVFSTHTNNDIQKWWVYPFCALALISTATLLRDEPFFGPRPTAALFVTAGIGTMTGDAVHDVYESASQTEKADMERISFNPQQYIDLGLAGPVRRLYLLGDSTPFYYHVPVLYHTTWDPSPLGSLLREHRSLAEAVRRLAAPAPEGFGVSHILINFSELQRLHSDGWYDPDATVADAERLIEHHGRIIREWQPANNVRIVLIELIPGAP